ncbi:MAG: hypothetical protein SF053_17680 [Bacteroidia bacterium]|nr:hypothetical protein [Bacteroidia bacterium]
MASYTTWIWIVMCGGLGLYLGLEGLLRGELRCLRVITEYTWRKPNIRPQVHYLPALFFLIGGAGVLVGFVYLWLQYVET